MEQFLYVFKLKQTSLFKNVIIILTNKLLHIVTFLNNINIIISYYLIVKLFKVLL